MIIDNISSIRILPNDKNTFKTIDDFKNFITNTMVDRGGYYYFPSAMMNCPKNTLVLFQYDAKICAVGILIDSKKTEVHDECKFKYAGYYKFDEGTVNYLDCPLAKDLLKQVYPEFQKFNQAKQIIPLEYLNDILELLSNTNSYTIQDNNAIIDDIESESIDGEIREALVKIRVNQSVFRERMLKKYNHCCLCGVTNSNFLVASHIKPWALSSPKEKLDVDNGLLLCPNHDKLFDTGMISFDSDGKIIISTSLSDNDKTFLNVNEKMKININDSMRTYLNFHRENVFK